MSRILEDNPLKMILSKPVSKNEPYKKIIMENKGDYYQLSKYTEKQVFHENIPFSILMNRCIDLLENNYQQLNAWSKTQEFSISISKKKKVLFHAKQMKSSWELPWEPSHNRKKQLCFVPVLAVDKHGNRLGKGKGYYDRFFAKFPNCKKVAVAFKEQVLDEIVTESHDIKMDKIFVR